MVDVLAVRPEESLRDRAPTPVGARGPSATPVAPRGRGPRWSQPVRPGLTRLVAAPLLVSGAALLAVALVVLPPAAGSGIGWALAGALVVHAAVVWLAPVRTRAGDLAVATAALTAITAITVSTVLVAAGLHAWAILLALPLLVCGCLVILAVFVVHGKEHMAALVAELERVAAVDGLTGLVTRRVLDGALAASLTTARSASGTALVLVDLDHVKAVDDVHGHPVGRAADLVHAVRTSPLLLDDGSALHLTVSVGVAHAPDHAADVRALYSVADAALYAAERGGRDGFAVASDPRG